MKTGIAVWTELGELFARDYPAQVNPTTGETRPWESSHTKIRDALALAGLDSKTEKQLCTRNAFLRGVRDWVEAQVGGKVDHSISDVLDTKTENTAEKFSIQIDDKIIKTVEMADGKEVKQAEFVTRCQLTVWKNTDTVTAVKPDGTEDESAQSLLRATMVYHREHRDSVDANRVVNRLLRDNFGAMGLIPWNGRGTVFVLPSYAAELDKVCDFLRRIGAIVDRKPQYDLTPYTPAGSQTAPNGSCPQGNTPAVTECLVERIRSLWVDCRNEVYRINSAEWKRETAKDKAETELQAKMENTLMEISHLRSVLSDQWESLNDNYLYVKREFDRKAKEEEIAVVSTVEQSEIDTVLETESIPRTVASTPENDFRDNVIHHALVVKPALFADVEFAPVGTSIIDVRKGQTPEPGMDYIGVDGAKYRAPKNQDMYWEMMENLFAVA